MYTKTWFKDVAERALATFVESALGLWILSGPGDLFNLDLAEGAAAAGLIAAAAVVKGAIAAGVGDKQSASLNPTLKVVDTNPSKL